MYHRRTIRRFVALALLATASPVAATAAPPVSGGVRGVIPPLPGLLYNPPWALPTATGPADLHEGWMTSSEELAFSQGWTDEGSWLAPLTPSPGSLFQHTAAASFPGRLDAALGVARARRDALSAGTISDAFALLAKIPGVTVDLLAERKSLFFGYRPQRARWLKSRQLAAAPGSPLPGRRYDYADYAGFDDVRLRAARLYCAARQAQIETNGDHLSLGERVGFSLTVLGHKIDFLAIEPTVAIDGPRAFPAPEDGTRAFDVPFLLGTVVTPIRGLGIPGLGEARVPLDIVTGDSEVRTNSEMQRVRTDPEGGLGFQYTKQHQTVAHADAFMSAGFAKPFKVGGDFTLFYVGPVRIFGLLGLTYEVGASTVENNRVRYASAPATRVGWLSTNPLSGVRYHDGPWEIFPAREDQPAAFWQVRADGLTDPFWRLSFPPATPPAYALRPVANDDQVVANATKVGLTLGIGGGLGAKKGPLGAVIEVSGAVTGTVGQDTVVRHALMAQDPADPPASSMRAMDAVTVRSRHTAQGTFDGIKATATMGVKLGSFGWITFKKTLFTVGAMTIASYDSDDFPSTDDEFKLRLAVGSGEGTRRTQPAVLSHLPGRSEFETFPVDVATCLADTDPLPPPPPPCAPSVDRGAPPRAEMCVYGPTDLFQRDYLRKTLPPRVCAGRSAFVGSLPLSDAEKRCVGDYLGFLCAARSKQQVFQGVSVVSRVWNGSLDEPLQAIVDRCGEAFRGKLDEAKAPAFVEGLVSVGACRKDATLLTGDDIVHGEVLQVPPAPRAGACSR